MQTRLVSILPPTPPPAQLMLEAEGPQEAFCRHAWKSLMSALQSPPYEPPFTIWEMEKFHRYSVLRSDLWPYVHVPVGEGAADVAVVGEGTVDDGGGAVVLGALVALVTTHPSSCLAHSAWSLPRAPLLAVGRSCTQSCAVLWIACLTR